MLSLPFNRAVKCCTVCGVLKPLAEFYKLAHGAGGVQSECKGCSHARNRLYHATHAVEIAKRHKQYQTANRPLISAKKAAYVRARRAEDPVFRILQASRTAIHNALRGGAKKSGTTQTLLGCTSEFLIHWLTGLLKSGMTWDNYGEWHIDHKRPCASFDLSDPTQQRACFHYTNLQPLWAAENRAKGAKLIYADAA